MGDIWTEESDKILINFVKKHEVLFNVKHKDYRKTELKSQLWREIATILNKSDLDCNKRWNYVRDYYVRRRTKYMAGVENSYELAKKRVKLLSFLDGAKSNESRDDLSVNESNDTLTSEESNDFSVQVKAESITDDYYANVFTESAEPAKDNLIIKYDSFDETDHFFAAITKIVRKLPRSEQIELRMQISAMVGKAELRQIENERK